jgi:hypothetical protein
LCRREGISMCQRYGMILTQTWLSVRDCHARCWKNCTCSAYQALSPSDGIGCHFWSNASSFIPRDDFSLFTFLLMKATKKVSQFKGLYLWKRRKKIHRNKGGCWDLQGFQKMTLLNIEYLIYRMVFHFPIPFLFFLVSIYKYI